MGVLVISPTIWWGLCWGALIFGNSQPDLQTFELGCHASYPCNPESNGPNSGPSAWSPLRELQSKLLTFPLTGNKRTLCNPLYIPLHGVHNMGSYEGPRAQLTLQNLGPHHVPGWKPSLGIRLEAGHGIWASCQQAQQTDGPSIQIGWYKAPTAILGIVFMPLCLGSWTLYSKDNYVYELFGLQG